MAKIRVHELAREVGKDNKDIIDYLTGKGYDARTAVSAVPDNEVENIRARFGAVKEAAPEVKQAQPEKNAEPKEDKSTLSEKSRREAHAADEGQKRKGIIRVFRSQNASSQLQKRPKTSSIPPLVPASEMQSQLQEKIMAEKAAAEKAAAEKAAAEKAAAEKAAAEKAAAVKAAAEKAAAEKAAADRSAAEKAAAEKETATKAAAEKAAAEKAAAEKAAAEKATSENAAPVKPVEKPAAAPSASVPSASVPEGNPARTPAANHFTNNQGQGSRPSYNQGQGSRPSYNQGQGSRPSYNQGQGSRPSYNQGQGSRPSYNQGQGSRPSYNQGQGSRPSYNQGQGSRPSYNQGQGSRPSYGQGQGSRPSYGQGQGSRPPYGQGQGSRPSYGQGQGSRPPYGQGQGSRPSYGQGQGSRPSYGQGQGSRPSYGQGSRPPYGQGRPPYGQNQTGSAAGRGRVAAVSRPADTDGALAHKTTRDFRKEGKDYDKTREERRELGKHGLFSNRPNQGPKQFSHIPKALQSNQPKNEAPAKKEVITDIKLPEKITIRDLAEKMKIQPAVLVKDLFLKGEMVTVNHEVSFDKAQEIALDYNIMAEAEEKEDVIGDLLAEEKEDETNMVSRPPVVCVMGHVDHGKTSLLDAIRNTHVTDREAGGITQHIGAYMVSIKGQKITFLDTPGHEAFTAMRMRGANSTDIAVLVVAADDGVMPQTVEAINHAKAAKVDIIVAVNKIDKPNANIERVKQELSEYGLIPEDWGGQTIFCPVSARTHEGIDNLLEMILLTSEVDELKANPDRKARGLVLEAKLDKGKGPVATILVQKGTLHQSDFIACGSAFGRVRAMTDEKGKRLHKATPSMPVEIIGLSAVPDAGEVLVALDSDKEAKDFAATFISEGKKNLIEETKTQMSLDDLFEQIKEGKLKELPIVVKADVQGSVEAVTQSLLKLSNDEVIVKVIHGAVGAITESDVDLAAASNAIIIGFNVRPDATAKTIADAQKVDIHLYNVIYEAIGDVEKALKGMRAAVYEEKKQGHAEIRQIFKASGVGNIAGSYIKDGIFQRSSKVRVFRGDEKIYEGTLASLKRFKDDVKEVKEGFECGLVFADWGDFAVDDTVEAYTMVEVPRE